MFRVRHAAQVQRASAGLRAATPRLRAATAAVGLLVRVAPARRVGRKKPLAEKTREANERRRPQMRQDVHFWRDDGGETFVNHFTSSVLADRFARQMQGLGFTVEVWRFDDDDTLISMWSASADWPQDPDAP